MVAQHHIRTARSLQINDFPISETNLNHFIWKTLNRREQAVLSRLRIGHTKFSRKHLIERTDRPYCDQCNVPISVKYIIIKCAKFSEIRKKLKLKNSLKKNLGNRWQVKKTIKFLKETNLFTLI